MQYGPSPIEHGSAYCSENNCKGASRAQKQWRGKWGKGNGDMKCMGDFKGETTSKTRNQGPAISSFY